MQNNTGGALICKQDGVYVLAGISSREKYQVLGGYEDGSYQLGEEPSGYQEAGQRSGYQGEGQPLGYQAEGHPLGYQGTSQPLVYVVPRIIANVYMNVSSYEAWITGYGKTIS